MADWRTVLESAQAESPNPDVVTRLLDEVMPGRTVRDISRLHGGLGAVLHRIDLSPSGGKPQALVLRQLMPEWGETGRDLLREATTVERLGQSGAVPVPALFWSDPSGDLLGRPAMLMEFVAGHCLVANLDTPDATSILASALAGIHGAPIDTGHLRRFERLSDHPEILGINPQPSEVVDADALKAALERATPSAAAVTCLVHGDFHGGNVLWDGVDVTAVLDWPIATVADPWWDEAYAHMDTWLAHGEDSAVGFRAAYRELQGHAPDPTRQRFWDLTALVRALPSPGHWLDGYRHAGATTLTQETLERRYVEMVERVL